MGDFMLLKNPEKPPKPPDRFKWSKPPEDHVKSILMELLTMAGRLEVGVMLFATRRAILLLLVRGMRCT